jgi:hypothetical protein
MGVSVGVGVRLFLAIMTKLACHRVLLVPLKQDQMLRSVSINRTLRCMKLFCLTGITVVITITRYYFINN